MRALVRIAAFGALAVLTACGQKSETKAPPAAGPPQAAAATPAPLAAAAWPKRKPGLWTQTMNLKAMGVSRSFRFCIDESTDRKIGLNSQGVDPHCRQTAMTRGLDGAWTVASTCDLGSSGKVESTIHVSGDFNARYVMDITTVTSGGAQPAMNGEHRMEMTAEWSGACPEGWTGGDVEMPGGRRINLVTKAASGG